MFNKNKDKTNRSVFDDMNKNPNSSNQPINQNQPPISNNVVENKPKQNNQDLNSSFFERYERSKKDIDKENKKQRSEARKSMSVKSRLLGFDSKLRDDLYVKKLWIWMIVVSIVLLAYSCVVMGFLGDKFYNTSDNKWSFVNWLSDMNKATVVFDGIIIALIPLPYIYLLAAWFIGVNNVHRSKPFVIVLLTFLSISLLLTLLVLPMSSIIFAEVAPFRVLQG